MKSTFNAKILFGIVGLLGGIAFCLGGSFCDVCGGPFGNRVALFTDRIDGTRKRLCEGCGLLPTICYRCGVPAFRDYLTLSDGRVLCRRDSQGVVLDEAAALGICRDTVATLNRLFGRFITFPEDRVRLRMMDRIDVRALYRIPGHDFSCPNVMGCSLSTTNEQGELLHDIRLLTGQTAGGLRAVTAHEYTHAWMTENVSRKRTGVLSPDAIEGFCELVAYLVTVAHGEEAVRQSILSNGYTRGQVHLFIEAEQLYGFNDVVDWIRYGCTRRLEPGNLVALRDVDMPVVPSRPFAAGVLFRPAHAAPVPKELRLKGIIQSSRASMAMINDLSLFEGEAGRARVGDERWAIRCLEIGSDSVLIEHLPSGRLEALTLSASEAGMASHSAR